MGAATEEPALQAGLRPHRRHYALASACDLTLRLGAQQHHQCLVYRAVHFDRATGFRQPHLHTGSSQPRQHVAELVTMERALVLPPPPPHRTHDPGPQPPRAAPRQPDDRTRTSAATDPRRRTPPRPRRSPRPTRLTPPVATRATSPGTGSRWSTSARRMRTASRPSHRTPVGRRAGQAAGTRRAVAERRHGQRRTRSSCRKTPTAASQSIITRPMDPNTNTGRVHPARRVRFGVPPAVSRSAPVGSNHRHRPTTRRAPLPTRNTGGPLSVRASRRSLLPGCRSVLVKCVFVRWARWERSAGCPPE
jgi:hypothetical protein